MVYLLRIIDEINAPILTILGISYRMGAMIIAEIGDFSRFDFPDKILVYAGVSPSIYRRFAVKPRDYALRFAWYGKD